jgi:segregation and condensation protein B
VSDETTQAASLTAGLTALLFVADGPLDLGSLARALGVSVAVAEQACELLAAQPPPGLMVQRLGSQVQLTTHPSTAECIRRLRGQAELQRLSRAALEVLSIVAYRQPSTRAEIEAIRGVNSDHALDTLLARGLVADQGRKVAVGRPVLFGTTLEFLQLVGLTSLDELPPLDDVSQQLASSTTDHDPRSANSEATGLKL